MGKVLVFGDMMVDSYRVVQPVKVSQEAPVLVNHHVKQHDIPGGAANAARQMQAILGVTPDLLGIVGGRLYTPVRSNKQRLICDHAGMRLISLLSKAKIEKALFPQDDWATIEKCRVIDTSGQQLMRIDTEPSVTPNEKTRKSILDWLALNSKNYDTLFISDYGKGTCFEESIKCGIEWFRDKFVIVNGKPENAAYYRGAHVVVMNQKEAEQSIGSSKVDLEELAYCLYMKVGAPTVVTAGAKGMAWYHPENGKCITVPACPPSAPIVDITGAGDILCAAIAAWGSCEYMTGEQVLTRAAETVSQAICDRRVKI